MLKSVAMWLPPGALLTFAIAVALVTVACVLGKWQRSRALFLLQADVWFSLWRTRHTSSRRANRVTLAALLVLLAVLPAKRLLGPTGPLERRERNPAWALQLRHLNTQIGDRKAVIFNVRENIEAMFYTPYVVYEFVPTASQVRNLHADGYQVCVFHDGSARLQALSPDVTVIRPD
ncbi:MAG TPA: hypothetical protein VM115_07445 [Vicinamibacterales bacterium]|nr:hypothetical protein [Vicinamibacterales bacterium]